MGVSNESLKFSTASFDKVPLLNKAETPFAPMWWDRYAEVSAERR